MLGRLFGILFGLVGLVVLVGAIGYFALKRDDIPYETLATTYESAASRYVDLPDGLRVHYRDQGQPAGAPTIVLVHGFSASLHTWEGWISRLSDDFRVISLDLPGHGLTRAPAGYQASIEGYGDVLSAFSDELDLQNFALAGSSMGGHVAWDYALRHPQQVTALILVDSAGWAPEGESANEPLVFKLLRNPIARPILRDIDNTRLIRQGLLAGFPNHPEMVDDAMVHRYADLARAPGHRDILIQMSVGDRHFATPERLAALTMPVLIMSGDNDNLVPVGDARKFKAAIQQADLVIFEGIGHVPQEEIPEQSAQAAWDFLYAAAEGSPFPAGVEAVP